MASLFSRALAGAGKEAGVLANQYITEELAQGRARLHAELQRTTASAMRKDQFEFENDPANVSRSNETGRQRVLSQAAAAREADLAGLTDKPYRAAKQAAADEDFAAETSRKIVGRKAEITEATPVEVAAADAKTCLREGATTAAYAVDHVIPKAEGGTDEETNLASICRPCHQTKSAAEAARGRGRAVSAR